MVRLPRRSAQGRFDPIHDTRSAPHRDDARVGRIVARFAKRQARAIKRVQLLDAGLTKSQVDSLVRRRVLHPYHHGVYAAGHDGLGPLGRAWAAALAVGPAAAICEYWAAWLHGLVPEPRGDVTVAVGRGSSGARSAKGYALHRPRHLPEADVMVRAGLRVTTIERTVLDLAATDISKRQLVRIINEAFRRKRLTQRAIQQVIDEHAGHPGRPRLARLADDRLVPTRSEAEDELFATMRAAGVHDFEVNTRMTGPERDAYFPAARLNVEVDGVDFHSLRDVIEADHERDRQGRDRGILTLRFTPRQVRERLPAVIAEIAAERARRTRIRPDLG